MSELSRKARGFIERARPFEGPTSEQRAMLRKKVLGAVGAATVTAVATSSVASASATSLAVLGKIVIACAIVGGVGIGAGLALRGSFSPHGSVAIPQQPPAAATAAEAIAPAVAPPEAPPTAPSAVPAMSASSGQRHLVREAPLSAPAPSASSSDALDAEVGLLRDAQKELSAGRADRALEILDAHERDFGSGVLSQERQAERVLVLCKLGRAQEATAAAEEFIKQYPQSPLAARVRGACLRPSSSAP